jgi:DNA-binding NarL/FixJ family response regulator
LLRVDGEGTVVAENAAAVELLGSSLGRACCEAVAATEGGAPHCNRGCAKALALSGATQEIDEAEVDHSPVALVCSAMGEDLVVAIVPSRTEIPANPLSAREKQVVELISKGHTNARIAKRLGIAPSTVRTHIERLLEKLHARSRAEAVTRAIATGQLRST